MPVSLRDFFGDRIQINSLLIVTSFVAVLGLSSQSAASWPTYFLGLAMAVYFRRWDDVFRLRYFWVILALVSYLVASSLWSTPFNWEGVARVMGRGLLIVLFVVACAECQFRGQLNRWLGRSLAIVASIAAGVALYVFLEFPDYHAGERLYGLGQLDNPIIAGLVFGAALIIMLDLISNEPVVQWRAIGLVCSLVLVAAIYYTGSRSAWLAVGGGVAIFVLANRTQDSQKFVMAVLSLGLVAAVVLFVLITVDLTRDALLPRGVSYRPDIWIETVERVIAGGPWLGLGIGTPDQITTGDLEFDHPHSLYISVFFQGGVLGVVLLSFLIVWTLRDLLRNYHIRDSKLALGLFSVALLGYLLDGHELIDKVSDMWFLFWLPVALSLGLIWRTPMVADEES